MTKVKDFSMNYSNLESAEVQRTSVKTQTHFISEEF